MTTTGQLTVERDGRILMIGLNRPEKRNAFSVEMLEGLSGAFAELEDDPELWAGVLYANGDDFTAGLDLAEVGPALMEGRSTTVEGGRDPWRNDGQIWTTPLVAAAQGWCLTAGIELLLAADIRVAASDTRFGQIEVLRGIAPFGGATTRFPAEAGWGNAMRWILTGDEFDAAEALRMGVVQEVVEPGRQVERAVEIARRIAERAAPLGVRNTMRAAHRAIDEGRHAASQKFYDEATELMRSEDGTEGMMSFIERRDAQFKGR